MTGARGAGEKSQRVAVHSDVPLGVDRGALGIGDARIDREPGGFAAARQLDGFLRGERPGVIEFQVRYFMRQRLRVHEPGIRILGRVAGNGARLLNRVAHRTHAKIRSARRSLPMTEVDGDTQSPVTLVFDGLHFAQARGNAEPLVDAGIRRSLRGSLPRRLFQHELDDIL